MSRTMNLLLVVALLLALALNSLPLPAHAMTPSAYIQWVHQFGATTSRPENDSASAIAVWGDLYVVGWKFDANGASVASVYRTDRQGNQVWYRQFGNGDTYAFGVAADNSGVYVVGMTSDPISGQTRYVANAAYLRKYDVNGDELWTVLFGTVDGDAAYDIAIDGSGVYVVGETQGTFPGQTKAGQSDAYRQNR